MGMLDTIRARRDEVYAIAKRHKAERLWVFGSCARGDETPESDIDFLVKFKPGVTLFDMGGLNSQLSRMFDRDVDVVADSTMAHEPYFSYAVGKDLVAL